jgi:hypothetical protein
VTRRSARTEQATDPDQQLTIVATAIIAVIVLAPAFVTTRGRASRSTVLTRRPDR